MPPRKLTDEMLEQEVHVLISDTAKAANRRGITISVEKIAKLLSTKHTRVARAIDKLCQRGYLAGWANGTEVKRFFSGRGSNGVVVVKKTAAIYEVASDSASSYQSLQNPTATEVLQAQHHAATFYADSDATFTQKSATKELNSCGQKFPSYILPILYTRYQVPGCSSESIRTPVREYRVRVVGKSEGEEGKGKATVKTNGNGASGDIRRSGSAQRKSAGPAAQKQRQWSLEKKPPPRLTPQEKFELRASQIELPTLVQFGEMMRGLYVEKFSCAFWRLKLDSRAVVTAAQRTVQLCRDHNWDLEDYLKVQFDWFAAIGRKPVVNNLCGMNAENRYDDWLREQGYVTEVSEGCFAADAEARNTDLRTERRSKEEGRLLGSIGMLPEQINRWVDKELDALRAAIEQPGSPERDKAMQEAKAILDKDRKDNPLMECLFPEWETLTEEQKLKRALTRALALRRHELSVGLSLKIHERTRLWKMILIEAETGKKSPVVNGDLSSYGLPKGIIEIHQNVCAKQQRQKQEQQQKQKVADPHGPVRPTVP